MNHIQYQTRFRNLKLGIKAGVLPAMATPLTEDGYRVNVPVLTQLVEFLVASNVAGLFVGGTTGEGILLDLEQRKILHEEALRAVDSRVPVIVHVGANRTDETLALAQHAKAIGAEAIAAVTPFYYPVHDDMLLGYYQTVAAAVPDTLFFAYDIPQMAVNGVGPELLARMGRRLPNFAGLKSSRPDSQAIRALLAALPGDAILLAGNERVALGLLALGAGGLISGLATAVPEPFVALTSALRRGDLETARHHQAVINQILDLIPPGARIGAIKKLLSQRGIEVGPAVPPRPSPSASWNGWSGIEPLLPRADSQDTDPQS